MMNNRKRVIGRVLLILATAFGVASCGDETPKPTVDAHSNNPQVLVFTKTEGYKHESIEAGVLAIQALAKKNAFDVIASDDAELFEDEFLSKIAAVVFLNTTGDVLNATQQIAMERYIQAGGGFVGVHAAADTEWQGDWYWYRNLVGAVFKNHPDTPSNVQHAELTVVNANHPSTQALPSTFELADEWYNFRDIYEFKTDVLTVKEASYSGGEHGEYHAIAWFHEYDGGRAFYTGLGHEASTFSDTAFLAHLEGGLAYAIGGNPKKDYSNVRPYDGQFKRNVLIDHLNEPMTFDFLPDGRILIGERPGNVKLLDPKTGEAKDLGFTSDVAFLSFEEMGLIGIAVDPNFSTNAWVYINHTAYLDDQDIVARVARFKLENDAIDFSKGTTIIEYGVEKNCCHMGGDLEFTEQGDLFISSGDNTNPHDQNGYNPLDFREGLRKNDAARSAGNTQDLRGKIIRITPLPEGGYCIPEGNLFTQPEEGRPEIYAMGTRNAFTLTYDDKTGDLFYGDVGPDASEDSDTRGPRGYDEVNRITQASHMGWPWVIANNQPYVKYDFATGKSQGPAGRYDPQNLLNESPNNTGAKRIPSAQPPLIWYPYGASEEFPEMGTGGRTALVAEVYRAEHFPEESRLPEYYEGKLFMVEFMRNWVKVISFDEQNGVRKIEPFAPQVEYVLPIDARFGPDGALYVLEYGSAWFKNNTDAQLSRVAYYAGEEGERRAAEPAGEPKADAPVGHQVVEPVVDAGAELAKANGCTACHKIDTESVGPAFKAVAERYSEDAGALSYLADKIAKGGGGVWGAATMPPFAHLDEATRTQLAEYVLSQ